MIRYYILNDKGEPVQCKGGVMEWARFLHDGPRVVKQEKIGGYFISTVFLGLDHNFTGEGPPIYWESMAFGAKEVEIADRCGGSREQAEAMHDKMVKRVKRLIQRKGKSHGDMDRRRT